MWDLRSAAEISGLNVACERILPENINRNNIMKTDTRFMVMKN
jgi:hypothetical protein